MYGIDKCNKEKLQEHALSDMKLLLKDIEFIQACGEKCEGPLCIYPDLDTDEELPVLVQIKRNNIIEIISYGDLDDGSPIETEIEHKLKELRQVSNIKDRYERCLIKLNKIFNNKK